MDLFYWKGRVTHDEVVSYTDSDYVRDLEKGRAFQLMCFIKFITVSWSSKKQLVITLSSTDAESIAAAES